MLMLNGFMSNKIDNNHVKDLPEKALFLLLFLIVFSSLSEFIFCQDLFKKDHIKLSGQPVIGIWCAYVPAVRYKN